MEQQKQYVLPELEYGYGELAPFISEELLKLHHDKHHASYVNGANAILQKLDSGKMEAREFDTKAMFKELSFHIGGHLLHSLFWKNLAPAGAKGGGNPSGTVATLIDQGFGSFEQFKKQFSQTANSTEGSGWAALTYCKLTQRPIIMQVEKHNTNVYPMFGILLVIDVWEHAYYLDYKNERPKFTEAFWNVVNWQEVNHRFEKISGE